MPVLAIRCDGDARVGAGHVARCRPLARAFGDRGWEVRFDGRFEGLAARMLDGWPRGRLAGADAAVLDSYERQAVPEVPLATIGEAVRYPGAVWIDYHLDRLGQAPAATLLPGPAYAPVEPAFAGAGRALPDPRDALVTVGASAAARAAVPDLVAAVRRSFPGVRVRVADGSFALVDVAGEVDLAVTGGGMTAYELASAGIPMVIVQLADNQRRVVEGCLREGIAVASVPELVTGPNRRGMELFDGRGAARAAAALEQRWALA